MRLIYRQTIVEEIRALIEQGDGGRLREEIEQIALTQPEWDRLEAEFGEMGWPWTDTHRIMVFGVPIGRG